MSRFPRVVPRLLGGRYALHEQLGAGAAAEVFRATDQHLSRSVAVKLLRPQFSASADCRTRFQQQAYQSSRLNHSHLVTVHDVGEQDERPYLVMEQLPGETVADLIREQRHLPLGDALRIVREACAGVGYAHSQGLVHGDLKPQNLLLDGDHKVRVSDFGMDLVADPGHRTTRSLIGRAAPYRAPEQLEDGTATARSDVFALGAILYELLMDRPPGGATTPALRQGSASPLGLGSLRADVPVSLARVLRQALARGPDARYDDATELGEALAGINDTDTVAARPQRPATPAPRPDASDLEARPVLRPLPRIGASVGGAGSGLWGTLVLAVLFLVLVVAFAGGGMAIARSITPALLTPAPAVLLPPDDPTAAIATSPAPQSSVTPAPTATSGAGDLVPQLVQLPRAQAEQWLQSLGLAYDIQEQFSEVVEEEAVISQHPVAMQPVTSDQVVQLVVSRGPRLRVMPDVIGVSTDEAAERLEKGRFEVSFHEAFSDTVIRGIVIAQEPAAGESLEAGTAVQVIVSQGSSPQTVPNVVGRDFRTAREILGRRGLGAKVIEQSDGAVPPGQVIAQIPAGGLEVPKGTIVTLAVQAPVPR